MKKTQLTSPAQGNKLKRYVLSTFLICITMLCVTACEYTPNDTVPIIGSSQARSGQQAISKDVLEEIARPANQHDGIGGATLAMESNAAAGNNQILSSGYKKDILFADKSLDFEQRLLRLENNVQNISDKLTKIEPTINRLSDIDSDMSLLMNQLETLLVKSSSEEVNLDEPQEEFLNVQLDQEVTNEIIMAEAPKNDVAKYNDIIPAAGSASSVIQKIRMNDHPNKTRIIFDSLQKISLDQRIDDNNILTVTVMEGIKSSDIVVERGSSFIQEVDIEPENQSVSFKFSKEMQNVRSLYVAPDSRTAYHRYFIDLK